MAVEGATPAAARARASEPCWSEERWQQLERETRRRILAAGSEAAAWRLAVGQARGILRAFSTGFFLATRFLPRAKRRRVEVIYASVRYPDEVVDSLPLPAAGRRQRLARWEEAYEQALGIPTVQAAVGQGVPTILAAFARVVRQAGIPPQHYRSFLAAMRCDVAPRPFADLADLVDSYVYGSAIVVGYFLAHVYGPGEDGDLGRSLAVSRRLGIALQLTNFLRDVLEDERRGRLYLPLDLLAREGVDAADIADPRYRAGLERVLAEVAAIADADYQLAEDGLDAFAADTRTAIAACIAVYRQLNRRIADSGSRALLERQSVPWRDKLRALPPSKVWRLPLAYLGAL